MVTTTAPQPVISARPGLATSGSPQSPWPAWVQRERLYASLAWMLDVWAARGRVTTTILGPRLARDIWTFGVDSLPLLLHALRAAEADDLIARHEAWLNREVERYAGIVIDRATGLVRDDRTFSTHRDTVRSRSNAYANAMLLLLDRHLRETDWLDSPVPAGAVDRFVAAFWRSDQFVDRPDRDAVTGDATVVPFFFGVVPDELGLGPALRAASEAGLTQPLPLRYAARRDRAAEDPVTRMFVPDYQGSAIWTSLGAMYLRLLQRSTRGVRASRPPTTGGSSSARAPSARSTTVPTRTCDRTAAGWASSSPTRRCSGAPSLPKPSTRLSPDVPAWQLPPGHPHDLPIVPPPQTTGGLRGLFVTSSSGGQRGAGATVTGRGRR